MTKTKRCVATTKTATTTQTTSPTPLENSISMRKTREAPRPRRPLTSARTTTCVFFASCSISLVTCWAVSSSSTHPTDFGRRSSECSGKIFLLLELSQESFYFPFFLSFDDRLACRQEFLENLDVVCVRAIQACHAKMIM